MRALCCGIVLSFAFACAVPRDDTAFLARGANVLRSKARRPRRRLSTLRRRRSRIRLYYASDAGETAVLGW